ncbi:MAG: 3-isopropylmalate dehydratase small subunit [Spirochaetales bacterium]|nr:3-isopropylmalate dehydratase small subunit [Spirochaetales bacterium]
MDKFENISSCPTPLDFSNVDTDQIIPKQFLKRIEKTGFGEFLFYDWRFNDDGSIKKDFVLNQEKFTKSAILLARDNFGCGSSREHAPWALKDYGFKVIISTSFADIFYNNCFKNGMLPIVVSNESLQYLFHSSSEIDNYLLDVNLQQSTIKDNNNFSYEFQIDKFRKKCLLEGLDDIALTLVHSEELDQFEKKLKPIK